MTEDGAERARVIAELRESAQGLLESLQASGEAMIVIATGVVLINGRWRDQHQGGIDAARIDEHYVRMVYAPAHESVHMVQLLTTRFVLEMGIEYFNLAGLAGPKRRSRSDSATWMPRVLADYRKAKQRLSGRGAARFSNLEVMEAHAVLEGFRGAASLHREEGLALMRRLAHGEIAEYSRVIDAALAAWGFEMTLSVLPRLCWLALNETEPGAALTQAVDSLTAADVHLLAEMTAADTCRAFGRDPIDLARSWRIKRPRLREHPLNSVLGRYFDVLETEADPEAYLQLVMQPGRAKASGSCIELRHLMPPMAVYADNVFLMNGPYRDEGWAAAEPLLRTSALVMESIDWLDRHSGASS